MTKDIKTLSSSNDKDIADIIAQNDEEWYKRFLLMTMIMIIILLGLD